MTVKVADLPRVMRLAYPQGDTWFVAESPAFIDIGQQEVRMWKIVSTGLQSNEQL